MKVYLELVGKRLEIDKYQDFARELKKQTNLT